VARWSTPGRPLVGQGGAAHNVPGQGVHGGNHEPLHDGAERVHHEGKFVRRIRCPVLCMRTNQPNQRPPNYNHLARQLDRSVAPSSSSAWWETHLSCSRGPRNHTSTTATLRHQSQCRDDNAPPFDQSAKTKRETVEPTVFLTRAVIMKVVARHEANSSKIGEQVSCSRRRCRPSRWLLVPEVPSAALRWGASRSSGASKERRISLEMN
jgi:hypothetical protein